MRNHITFGSVCSGIEAASVAWHPLGWRAAWLAEIEVNPSIILSHHYPDVPNLGDMNCIPQLLRNGDIPPPDVFCGGTPCQAFSLAGLRNSLNDARGNLSLTFCEIANEIDIQRAANGLLPATVFWENVPGVLSTQDNAFGYFLAGLAGEDDPLVPPGKKWANAGCVYGPQRAVAWRVIDAQYFGLAQRRKRVFVVASSRKGFDPAAVLFEFDGLRRDSPPSREAREETAGTLAARTDGGGFPGTDEACSGYVQVVAAVDVCPTLRAGGNSTGGDRPPGTDVDTADSLLIAFDSRQECVSSTEVFGSLGSTSPRAQAVAFSCKDYGADACVELAPTMRAMGHSGSHANAGGQLAVAFDTTQITSPTNRSNPQYGDPCHTLSSHGHAPAVCITGDITHTLKAEGFDASEDGTGRGQPIVAAFQSSQSGVRLSDVRATLDANNGPRRHNGALVGMAVRRLMPVECEKLQGFPPGYTAVPLPERRKDARGEVRVMADGPRYKALGNSWAVPVVRWLGRRIDAQLRALDVRAA